jgi:hypothetical protein
MPAKSKAQQQAMAIAEHHPEAATGAAKEMAESMSKETLHDFAATPTKGLPKHRKAAGEHFVHGFMCGYLRKTAGPMSGIARALDAPGMRAALAQGGGGPAAGVMPRQPVAAAPTAEETAAFQAKAHQNPNYKPHVQGVVSASRPLMDNLMMRAK